MKYAKEKQKKNQNMYLTIAYIFYIEQLLTRKFYRNTRSQIDAMVF